MLDQEASSRGDQRTQSSSWQGAMSAGGKASSHSKYCSWWRIHGWAAAVLLLALSLPVSSHACSSLRGQVPVSGGRESCRGSVAGVRSKGQVAQATAIKLRGDSSGIFEPMRLRGGGSTVDLHNLLGVLGLSFHGGNENAEYHLPEAANSAAGTNMKPLRSRSGVIKLSGGAGGVADDDDGYDDGDVGGDAEVSTGEASRPPPAQADVWPPAQAGVRSPNKDIVRQLSSDLPQLSSDLDRLEEWIDNAVSEYTSLAASLAEPTTDEDVFDKRVSDVRARWDILHESTRKMLNTSPDDATTRKFQKRIAEMVEADKTLQTVEDKRAAGGKLIPDDRVKIEGVEYLLDAVEFALGSRPLAAKKEFPVVWVTFVLNCTKTKPGDKLLLVGDGEEIGDWEPVNASRLATDPHTYPIWNCTVPLRAGRIVTYKYCIGRPSDVVGEFSSVLWEGHMGNREIRVHRNVKRPMIVTDHFHLAEEYTGNIADSRAPSFVSMHSHGYQDPEFICFD